VKIAVCKKSGNLGKAFQKISRRRLDAAARKTCDRPRTGFGGALPTLLLAADCLPPQTRSALSSTRAKVDAILQAANTPSHPAPSLNTADWLYPQPYINHSVEPTPDANPRASNSSRIAPPRRDFANSARQMPLLVHYIILDPSGSINGFAAAIL